MAERVVCQDIEANTVLQHDVEHWVHVGVRIRCRGTPDWDRQAPRLVESLTTALRLKRWRIPTGALATCSWRMLAVTGSSPNTPAD
ncbi:hypothetical protein HDE_03951 [Halotydeus destructor]|nr:hypothetical protein HDE_03951 [Halotydeus destructor]